MRNPPQHVPHGQLYPEAFEIRDRPPVRPQPVILTLLLCGRETDMPLIPQTGRWPPGVSDDPSHGAIRESYVVNGPPFHCVQTQQLIDTAPEESKGDNRRSFASQNL